MKTPSLAIWLLNAFLCGFIAGVGFGGWWNGKNAPGCPPLQKVGNLPVVIAPLPPDLGKGKGVLPARPILGRGLTPIFDVSAYCLCSRCCGQWSKIYPRRTASGHIIQPGDKFLAAPRSIPFGTMIAVPGYNNNNPVRVEDRGSAINGNKLDCFYESHVEALKFGRQNLIVKIEK